MKRYFLYLLLVCVPVFSKQNMLTEEQAHQEFLEVFRTVGVEAARAYLDGFLNDHQDPRTLYYIGWTEFIAGNYDAALLMVAYLEIYASHEDLLAATYYLKGQVFIHDGNLKTDPEECLQLGLKMYQAIEHKSGIYRSQLGLASAALAKNELEHANRFLLLAFRTAVKYDLSLVAYHSVAYRVQLSQGNYDIALKHLYGELQIHERNKDLFYVYNVYVCLATVYLIKGDITEARRFNDDAIEYFTVHNDKLRMSHALLNRFFIQGCFSEVIDERIIKDEFPEYLRVIYDFLKNEICK